MAHIALPDGFAGITAGFAFRPEIEGPMRLLADTLLRGPSTLTPAERELIGVVVSAQNDCDFCRDSHRAAAAHCLGGDYRTVDSVSHDHRAAPISAKMRALLDIAAAVRAGGRHVTSAEIDRARAEGASDLEIHDTVLIAAMFCMFNRYVDGLAAWTPPRDTAAYDEMGRRMARDGYRGSSPPR